MRCLALLWGLGGLWVAGAWAAGPLPELGSNAGSFAQVLTPPVFEFPRDHGPHPAYRQEWWYVTGNLDAADGQRFGFELTFFRFGLVGEGAVAAGVTHTESGGDVGGLHEADGSHSNAVADVKGGSLASRDTGGIAVADARGAGRPSSWRTGQIYMADFAITDVARKRFRFAEKLSRGAVGLAGAETQPFRVWVEDWGMSAMRPATGSAAASAVSGAASLTSGAASSVEAGDRPHWRLHALEAGYELTLDAQALLPPVLNGDRGLSRKSDDPGSASAYYSLPRVAVHGQLVRDGQPLDVNGLAWVDREWSSGPLSRSEQGWDWFALQLNDGSALMFYSLRHLDGTRDHHSAGTWVTATGQSQTLTTDQVQIDVLDYWVDSQGARYPSRWRVRVPTQGLDVEVRPVLADQELTSSVRYWEGAVDVTGTRSNRRADGRGYVELVGYAAQ